MKTIVRCFVVVLALTGAIATTSASAKATVAKNGAAPAPRCPLNDPNGCNIGNW